MSSLRIFFLLFLIVPVLEIYLLIQVGSVIGALWTALLVVFTAIVGASQVQRQGLQTVSRIQSQLHSGSMPAMEMVEGFCLFLAGALLITPGFFTDSVGFALLIPPLRRYLISQTMLKFKPVTGFSPGLHNQDFSRQPGDPIDGDFHRLDD